MASKKSESETTKRASKAPQDEASSSTTVYLPIILSRIIHSHALSPISLSPFFLPASLLHSALSMPSIDLMRHSNSPS